MSPWILIPCLVRLRAEFDVIAPGRDRKSDGSRGDTAHAGAGTSDHLPDEDFAKLRAKDPDRTNEVHAIDVDDDLRTAGLSMEAVVQFLVGRCRAGTEQRLRYIIYNRRIWEASNGWRGRPYTGENAHTEHAHFSASYETKHEMSTASWHLEDLIRKEEPMALTQADIDAIWTKDINPSPSASNLAYTTVFSTFQTVNSMATALSAAATEVTTAKNNAAAAALSAGNAAAAVAFLADDFPNDGDPEEDPFVKRIRYVLANPVTP
jgi:hypothetical protein